ncbi:MAG: autotransporter outer membrane beta-barrel domain-containing protein [Hafnia sp.]
MKGHSKFDDGKNREFEPFVEVNWLHNTRTYSTRMNSVKVSQDGTRNVGEIKNRFRGADYTEFYSAGKYWSENGR